MNAILLTQIYDLVFKNQILQQYVGISLETNCAPLLADYLVYSYEEALIQMLMHEKRSLD